MKDGVLTLLDVLIKRNTNRPREEHVAMQYGDEYQCKKCGKAWDVRDPEPPLCRLK